MIMESNMNQTRKRATHIHSSSKSIRKSKQVKQDEEEKRLTELIFGHHSISKSSNLKSSSSSAWHDDDDDDDEEYPDAEDTVKPLFHIDRLGEGHDGEDNEEQPKVKDKVNSLAMNQDKDNLLENNYDDDDDTAEQREEKKMRQDSAAWMDDDDHQVSVSLVSSSGRLRKLRSSMSENIVDGNDYQQRLRERFQSSTQYTSKTDWAKVQSSTSTSNTKDTNAIPTATTILSSTKPLISSTSIFLPPHILHVLRRPDINLSDPNQSVVQAVQFHPRSDEDTPLLFTAGLDKTLRFFRIVDDKMSEKIHGIHCTFDRDGPFFLNRCIQYFYPF